MPRPFLRRAVAGALAALALTAAGVLAAPAASAAEPLPAVTVTVAPYPAELGTALRVQGSGCFQSGPDTGNSPSVFITTGLASVRSAVPVGGGAPWSAGLMFPAGTPAGTYTISSVCDDYWSQRKYPDASITLSGAHKAVVVASGGVTFVTAAPGQSLTPATPAAPGQKFQLNLSEFGTMEKTSWTLHSTPRALGEYTADATGTLSVALTIPADVEAGDHELWVTRADGSIVKYPITIAAGSTPALVATAGPATTSGPSLPNTGSDVTVPLALGGVLLVAGAGTIVAARRRGAEVPRS